MIQPLLDADVLRYEVGYAAEAGWQQPGFPHFDYVAELLDMRINNICAITNATHPPILYLTEGSNFRDKIATRTPYKQRSGEKPWHFKNITAYMKAKYDVRSQDGLEADDLMALEQTRRPKETIICTRDKDARSVPGYLYSWELGNQPSFGPFLVTEPGEVHLSDKRDKLTGTGSLFFYGQCLTGDTVDSIPGLPKCGPVKAFTILEGASDEDEAFKRVREAYQRHFGDRGDIELLEQGRLLNMSRKFINNKVLLWNFPNCEYEEWMNVISGAIERVSKLQS